MEKLATGVKSTATQRSGRNRAVGREEHWFGIRATAGGRCSGSKQDRWNEPN
jgi:hypothetical protein